MLNLRKNTTLTGVSVIEGKDVFYMNASVGEDNSFSSSVNQEYLNLWFEHNEEVMQDMQKFNDEFKKIKEEYNTQKQQELSKND